MRALYSPDTLLQIGVYGSRVLAGNGQGMRRLTIRVVDFRRLKSQDRTLERAMGQPPLKSLHADRILSPLKLSEFRRLETTELIESLRVGRPGALKTRPDGTILDGHHRIAILRERKVNVDALPREVLAKEKPDGSGEP